MLLRILVAVAVAALAFGLRWRAIERLPTDYDETPYLTSARELADVLRSGDLAALTKANLQPEHPQLNQLLFAVALLPAPALGALARSRERRRRAVEAAGGRCGSCRPRARRLR